MDPRQPQESILSSPPPLPLPSSQVLTARSGPKFWVIVLIILLVLLLVGAGIYAYFNFAQVKAFLPQ